MAAHLNLLANDAKKIIESSGLKVPKNILANANEQPKTEEPLTGKEQPKIETPIENNNAGSEPPKVEGDNAQQEGDGKTDKISKAGLKKDYGFTKEFPSVPDQEVANKAMDEVHASAAKNGITPEQQAANEVELMKNKKGEAPPPPR